MFTFAAPLVDIALTEVILISRDLASVKEIMGMMLGSRHTKKWWEVLVYQKQC